MNINKTKTAFMGSTDHLEAILENGTPAEINELYNWCIQKCGYMEQEGFDRKEGSSQFLMDGFISPINGDFTGINVERKFLTRDFSLANLKAIQDKGYTLEIRLPLCGPVITEFIKKYATSKLGAQ
jgi:hypothetical protein